jgi:predicted N-acetyltransferase YhbS
MSDMEIRYEDNRAVDAEEFSSVLRRSTLGERRPVDDRERIAAMLANANLLVTAWAGGTLIGVARSVTDFAYCCYLSDLAVDEAWQGRGVGAELIRRTQARLHPDAKLILLSAPKAVNYYPKIGFEAHPSAWVVGARAVIGRRGGEA